MQRRDFVKLGLGAAAAAVLPVPEAAKLSSPDAPIIPLTASRLATFEQRNALFLKMDKELLAQLHRDIGACTQILKDRILSLS